MLSSNYAHVISWGYKAGSRREGATTSNASSTATLACSSVGEIEGNDLELQ